MTPRERCDVATGLYAAELEAMARRLVDLGDDDPVAALCGINERVSAMLEAYGTLLTAECRHIVEQRAGIR